MTAPDTSSAVAALLAKKPRTLSATVTVDPGPPAVNVTLTFQALPRDEWRALIEAYPATDEQQNEAVQAQARQGIAPSKIQRLRWNADTFPPAAIAACCIEPAGLSLSDAEAIWSSPDYNDDELQRIFSAVLAANESADGSVMWGKGSGTTPASGKNSG